VTGVQTCALPILWQIRSIPTPAGQYRSREDRCQFRQRFYHDRNAAIGSRSATGETNPGQFERSEKRRVRKKVKTARREVHSKKKRTEKNPD